MRKSIIDALHATEAVIKNEECAPHVVIGIDSCSHGTPHAGVLLTHGSPAVILGMIESLMKDLKDTKKNILKEMSLYKKKDMATPEEIKKKIDDTKSEVESIIKRLPPGIAEKVKAFQDRMNEAIEKNDVKALEQMRDQISSTRSIEGIDEILKKMGPLKSEDDNFDIEDFKGGA